MKKHTLLLLVLAAALALSACGGTAAAGSAAASPAPTTAASAVSPQASPAGSAAADSAADSAAAPSAAPAASPTAAPATAPAADPTAACAIPAAYLPVLNQYADALAARESGGVLRENGLNGMLADLYGDDPFANLGYALTDLDNDGTTELLVGATDAVTDDFYGKLILELYTLTPEGEAKQVFSSAARDRIYYAGQDKFASLGSSGAADSFVTTLRWQAGELIDMTYTTAPAQYVQLPMASFAGHTTAVNDPLGLYSWDAQSRCYIPYQSADGQAQPIGKGNGWYYYDAASGSFLPW